MKIRIVHILTADGGEKLTILDPKEQVDIKDLIVRGDKVESDMVFESDKESCLFPLGKEWVSL